jgi:fructose-1,6-bisphosphatase/sedoheptulose 1,7-bisphosphatase-like protein
MEAVALASAQWMGLGMKNDADETHCIVMRSKTKMVYYFTAHHHFEHEPHLVMV